MELADMAWKIFSPPKKSPEKLTRIHSGVCFFLALVICGHLNAPMHLGAEEIAVMVNPVVKIAGDILTICCVFSHQQHHAVLFRGNKWNTVNAAAICVGSVICPARPHRFLYFNLARYDSSAPVPKFPCRVGSQGWAECGKVDWLMPASSRLWYSEREAPRDDRGGEW